MEKKNPSSPPRNLPPPVYRTAPVASQPKSAMEAHFPPGAPPVYRPFGSAPQLKRAAPPVYRPKPSATQAKPALQRRSNPVVQRTIVIEGVTYNAGDLAAFNDRYSGHIPDILVEISDLTKPPRTIPAALEDPRRFIVDVERTGDGVFFGARIEAEQARVEGGIRREAGRVPVLIQRPAHEFIELKIGGLISCIGIILEARNAGRIEAASGSHFVTPALIKDGRLTFEGQETLRNQIGITRPFGILTAKLMHVDKRHVMGGGLAGDVLDAYKGMNLIIPFLLSAGVTQVNITNGNSERVYRLSADGSGALA